MKTTAIAIILAILYLQYNIVNFNFNFYYLNKNIFSNFKTYNIIYTKKKYTLLCYILIFV